MTVADRRRRADRRIKDAPVEGERRSGIDRRLQLESAAGQVQTVLGLLTQIAESRSLSDENRRLLDTAMLRLRFAIGRMEAE
jgi:hypothetical protein